MLKNISALQEVIDPSLEPGVISHKMIQDAFLNLYYGEQRRLKELEPIEYEKFTIMRLEFKNILRIDHLWILPNLTKLSLSFNKLERIENIDTLINLKELNLSFNYIEKIENLETLTKLESLSLFNNLIMKIENLDNLKCLEILSIGNNKIDSSEGLERFRFFKNLKVLNLEGNPIAKDDKKPLRVYLAALLPNLQYYNYIFITEKEREECLEKHRHAIELIETNESDELILIAKKEKDIADEIRLSKCFVEFLNERQLFNSLWDNDEEAIELRTINPDAIELINNYNEDLFKITQEIYKIGVEKYDERKEEIETFEKYLKEGQESSQRKSISSTEDFLEESEDTFNNARALFIEIEKYLEQGLDENSNQIVETKTKIDELYNSFKNKLDNLWEILMGHEVNLYEAIEEVLNTFDQNITKMLQSFLESVLKLFVTLREICKNFIKNLLDVVTAYIEYHISHGGNYDIVPKSLHKYLDNKDKIPELIESIKRRHIDKINEREDRLITRSKTWVKEFVSVKRDEELVRNRNKLTEINYFMSQMREAFHHIQVEVREELENL
ncbi:dynein regulatory complex subunit 3 [Condylostylus longicornis]|uniref:dynein regulatory complex subunit 3 n=1 Tax=Condylostylus longicornis TaxID=2530218 RepID=UPI00244E2597|nr:dynein regulatory complex subunit 3 [Condylostylus longicornis]